MQRCHVYHEDTFFALGLLSQLGLAILSLTLAVLTVWLAWRLGRRSRWVTRILIGLGVYMVFAWGSPSRSVEYQT